MLKSNQTEHRFNWPDITFYASALQEKFAEASFITLKEHFYDICSQQAFYQIYSKPTDLTNPNFFQAVKNRTKYIIQRQDMFVYEHIRTFPNKMVVCLDCYDVTDKTIFDALDKMSQLDDTLLQPNKVIPLGQNKTFTLNEFTFGE